MSRPKRAIVVVLCVLAASAIAARATCPALLQPYPFSRTVFDRDGRLLRLSLAPDQTYRVFVPLQSMSPQLVEATLAYEDRWFYAHPGISPVALAKAAVSTWVT